MFFAIGSYRVFNAVVGFLYCFTRLVHSFEVLSWIGMYSLAIVRFLRFDLTGLFAISNFSGNASGRIFGGV